MKLIPTRIPDVHRVQLTPIEDDRGFFLKVLEVPLLQQACPDFSVFRVNRSLTRAPGAIRGLHFQKPPRAEGKLVQCLRGMIFDVAVDLRPGSPTYRQWVGSELSAENRDLLLIPRGFAHGFQTLTEDCLIEYFVDEAYAPELEGGFRWNDPALGIEWPLPCSQISAKDAAWPLITA